MSEQIEKKTTPQKLEKKTRKKSGKKNTKTIRSIVKKTPDDRSPNELKKLIETISNDFIDEWLNGRDVNILSITEFSMIVVEKASMIQKMSGKEKYELAKTLIPLIVNIFQEKGYITEEKGDEIRAIITTGSSIIDQFIPLAIEIAKHPIFIQATETVTEFIDDKFEEVTQDNKCLKFLPCFGK